MSLFLFLLATWGLTLIVTQSYLFAPIRERLNTSKYTFVKKLGKLSSCPMCFGFWAGLIVFYLPDSIQMPLLMAWASSGFAWIVFVVLHKLGASDL